MPILYNILRERKIFVVVILLLCVGAGVYKLNRLLSPQSVPQTNFRVSIINAKNEKFKQKLSFNGVTDANKRVQLSAEISAPIAEIHATKGAYVKKGEILVSLDIDNRISLLKKAQAAFKQRDMEFKAAKTLSSQSFKSESKLAESESNYQQAKSDLSAIITEINNTKIVAPFDGIVDEIHIELGDYLRQGDKAVKMLAQDSIKVKFFVNENEINKLRNGSACYVRFADNLRAIGHITYIGCESSAQTRSFPVEATLENNANNLKIGLTAAVEVEMDEVLACCLPASILSLDDDGSLVLKFVDHENKVECKKIDVLQYTQQGIWVAGIEDGAKIIHTGHPYVHTGQLVDTVEN